MRYLVTGAAGFIGFHVSRRLLLAGHQVVGADNLNDYYDVNLKTARLELLKTSNQFSFIHCDITDRFKITQLFSEHAFQRVIHLAAQAGVRYSIDNPHAYADTNLVGFLNVLEGCRHYQIEHLLYASSSSVYGLNRKTPFSTSDTVDHPVSFYAATKKANELMAHTYSHLYGIPTTGLRFFTVYGPWGRPDMALFKFTRAIIAGERIDIYNYGQMQRDFTYIDDITESIIRLLNIVPTKDDNWAVEGDKNSLAMSSAPYRIYNIGYGQPVKLMTFIEALERALGINALKNMLPLQPGDVSETNADVQALYNTIDYKPKIGVELGIKHFTEWYKSFYGAWR